MQRFAGEVLFLLLGEKCCVIFSNIPLDLRASYVKEVLEPSGVLAVRDLCTVPQLTLIRRNVRTWAEHDLQGDIVLINTKHAAYSAAVHALRLTTSTMRVEAADFARLDPSQEVERVDERELAHILNYPIALDECSEPLIEVGYFHTSVEAKHLLTSYIASATNEHRRRIQVHFEHYKYLVAECLPLLLYTTRV